MAFSNASGAYAEQLKGWGCLRVRVPDRKKLAEERQRVNQAAASLNRRAYTSYRYPYLYARLGERLEARSTDRYEGGPLESILSEIAPLGGVQAERA